MKRNLTFLILILSIIFSATSLFAQTSSKIHPVLQNVLQETQSNEFIDVYVVLKERLNYDDLQSETYYLPKKEKRREVVRMLKTFAQQNQANVMSFLQTAKNEGSIKRIDNIWALNVIAFESQPEVITQLAQNFPEVSMIHFDPEIPEEELIDEKELNNPVSPVTDFGDFAPQQGLILINAPLVWAQGDSGQGVIVANIDTGTDWDHPDLVNNIWNNLGEDADNDGHTLEWNGSSWQFDPGDVNGVDDDSNGKIDDFIGWDYSGNDNNPYNPGSSHGTSTSGIVAGDGTNGTQTGVAPSAKLMILRPSGESQIWLAQQYAIDMGADITTSSLSYKWYFSPQPNYPMWRQICDIELAAELVHTNSTSNDGNNQGSAPIPFNISAPGNVPTTWIHPDQDPGGISSVIGVGNVDAFSDVISSSSPHGPATWEDIQVNHPSYPYPMPLAYQDYPFETVFGSQGLLKPDVSAPGTNTTSTVNGTGYSTFGGTSGATPHVAGTVALMLSGNPMLTVEDVSRIIQTTSIEKGTPGKDSRYGAGRIDALLAYNQAVSEIPVELTSFTANSNGNSVTLNWSTATETNNSGFVVERKLVSQTEWYSVGSVEGNGTTTEPKSYSFTDTDLRAGQYNYRLKQVDYDGTTDYSSVVLVDVAAPVEFGLAQNYPNPFNPSTMIEFSLPEKSSVKLEVFSVLGEKVAELINKEVESGYHQIEFNASNLVSGTYIYRIEANNESGNFVKTHKMILMK